MIHVIFFSSIVVATPNGNFWAVTVLHSVNNISFFFFFHGATAPGGPGPPRSRGFTITLRHTTLGRTPLDRWSARRRDLYLTKHNTHERQTSTPPAGFEPAIPASERPETHALDCVATEIQEYRYGNEWNTWTKEGRSSRTDQLTD